MQMNASSIVNQKAEWEKLGVKLPAFDHAAMTAATKEHPIWVHFGAGNIFRGFIAALQQRLLNEGAADRGIIAADTFDYDIIDKIYTPYDNLTMNVTLNPDGTTSREIIGSVAEGLRANSADAEMMARFKQIFTDPSLQMISFTITEKGYALYRPDAKVQDMLAKDGFEDNYTIVTEKHTFTAPFVNAEETQYLCIEDHYTNGRPPLELGGVLYCDRETVDKIEKMKVCTCLNPLHTAMSIYGCMLGYTLISAEMADEDLRSFIQKIGYIEAMPVVVDPGVLNPYEFIGAVINRRLPNPFMPDAPQRIATDTSQKLAIRFGETIKAYQARGLDKSNLVLIPLVLAGYARYLKGIDDNGKAFEISPDPMLAELQAIVAPLEVKEGEQDFSCLKNLYSRADVFGVDLYEVGLGEQIEGMVKELYAGNGAVRKTLHKYVVAR